jgi:3-methyladenine DNA glycosylase AlkC
MNQAKIPQYSSKNEIKSRAAAFFQKSPLFNNFEEYMRSCIEFLNQNYQNIPENERIGKGRVFIIRAFVTAFDEFISGHPADFVQKQPQKLMDLINYSYDYGTKHNEGWGFLFAIHLFARLLQKSTYFWNKIDEKVVIWTDHKDWEIRESACEVILEAFRYDPEKMIQKFNIWIESENENLRRAVVESIRPHAQIKWLRNPEKNDEIIALLTRLRSEPSEYVRKSVGNNFKDLSKYMPVKVLFVFESWVNECKVHVSADLASKTKKDLGADIYYMVWIMKFGLRWLHERNPEYNTRIQKIVGENYIKFFHEKRNFTAKPK